MAPPGGQGISDDSLVDAVSRLFDGVSYVMFSIKDAAGQYVAANQAFTARAGVRPPGRVLGRTAHDLFATELADLYVAQDHAVRNGQAVRDRLELINRPDGTLGWCLTTKTLIGSLVVAVSVDLRAGGDESSSHAAVVQATEIARRRCIDGITVRELATAVGLSPSQLERATKRTLGLSPKQLLVKSRVEHAVRLLTDSTSTLAQVAAACGFYDQSALSRQFRAVVGFTPGAYRAEHGHG
jgi:AraC-like DNA-binding protein